MHEPQDEDFQGMNSYQLGTLRIPEVGPWKKDCLQKRDKHGMTNATFGLPLLICHHSNVETNRSSGPYDTQKISSKLEITSRGDKTSETGGIQFKFYGQMQQLWPSLVITQMCRYQKK